MTRPTLRRVLLPSKGAGSETAVVTTPTTGSVEIAAPFPKAADAAVPTECRICGELLLLRRPGRDTCARHPDGRDDMVGLPPA